MAVITSMTFHSIIFCECRSSATKEWNSYNYVVSSCLKLFLLGTSSNWLKIKIDDEIPKVIKQIKVIEHFIFLTRFIGVPKLFMLMLTIAKTASDYSHDILVNNARLLSRILFLCLKAFRSCFWRACYIFRIRFFLSLTFLIIWWLLCLLGWLFAYTCRWFTNFITLLLCCCWISFRLIIIFWGLFSRGFAVNGLFLQTARLCSEWWAASTFLGSR